MKNIAPDLGGLRLHAVEEGAGEPVLLLHGWGATEKFWRLLLPVLAPSRRCIALDWPGFGASDKPDAPYTMAWLAEVLGRAMDALGIVSADMIAHSMGATAAMEFALVHPGRVRRLVLVNALVQGSTAFSFWKRVACLPVVRRIVWWFAHLRWVRRWVAKDFSFAARIDDEMIDDVVRGTYASLFRTIASMRATDLVPRLPELRSPVLVVGSDRDEILLPVQQEILRKGIPGATYVQMTGCGHIPMLERPEEFHRCVTEFLSAP